MKHAEPYFAVDASWWEVVRETIPRPWPEEAALIDLRWHADRVRLDLRRPPRGRPPHRMPGRPLLARRWGWDGTVKGCTPYAVGELLTDTERWRSPLHPENDRGGESERRESDEKRQVEALAAPFDSVSTAFRQRFDSVSTAPPTANAENPVESDSVSTADRQRIDSVSTAATRDTAVEAENIATQRTKNKDQSLRSLFPIPPALETAEQSILLRILRRWDKAPDAPKVWAVDYGEALGWFATAIVMEYGASVDVRRALEDWSAALEDEAARYGRPGTKGESRFPRIWKNGLRNWMRVRAERTTGGQRDHTTEGRSSAPPSPPSRAASRGQHGAVQRLPVRTSDGGGDLDF